MFFFETQCTSGCCFIANARLGMSKFMYTANFYGTSESTAELLLLPCSENGRRHTGSLLPVFDHFVVTSISFLRQLNFLFINFWQHLLQGNDYTTGRRNRSLSRYAIDRNNG